MRAIRILYLPVQNGQVIYICHDEKKGRVVKKKKNKENLG